MENIELEVLSGPYRSSDPTSPNAGTDSPVASSSAKHRAEEQNALLIQLPSSQLNGLILSCISLTDQTKQLIEQCSTDELTSKDLKQLIEELMAFQVMLISLEMNTQQITTEVFVSFCSLLSYYEKKINLCDASIKCAQELNSIYLKTVVAPMKTDPLFVNQQVRKNNNECIYNY